MKKSILYLFPVVSVISIVIALLLPVVRLDGLYSFWIFGYPFFPWEVVHIFDIPLKNIFSMIVGLLLLLTISIFLLRKYPDRLNIISTIWLGSGIGIIILAFLWITSWNLAAISFAPLSSTFEFAIFIPFISGTVLIFGKIYAYIFSRQIEE